MRDARFLESGWFLPLLRRGIRAVVLWAVSLTLLGASVRAQSPNAASGQVDDARLEQNLMREIEEAESQLHRAQRELKEIEGHVARSEEELRKQRQRENELKKTIQQYRSKIQGNNRALEIFRYNLQEKFPREKKKLGDRLEAIGRETAAMDRILAGLIHSSVAWPFERDTFRARRAVLARKILDRVLPATLENKRRAIREIEEIEKEIARIDRDIQLDTAWIEQRLRRNETHSENVDRENERLKAIARQKQEAQQEIQRGKERKTALQGLVALLQERLPLLRQGIDYKVFTELKGMLHWPVRGRVVHEFGTRKHPKFNLKIENAGIDIEAQPGTEVRASADGWVMFSGELPGYGSLIMLHHGGKYFTIYTPVAAEGLAEQQRIRQGQIIGRVTDGQNQGESVLHFEIRHEEEALNPQDWLP